MKKFIVNDGTKEFEMILPTSIKEITNEYLESCVAHVEVAPYHAIIACIYRQKLPEIVSASKKKNGLNVGMVPVLVKFNIGEVEEGLKNMFANVNTGDKIIISGTDIARGYEISAPKNFITIENILNVYNNDNSFAKAIMPDQNQYLFIDFKLVTINDIKGFYKDIRIDFVNPFIVEKVEDICLN